MILRKTNEELLKQMWGYYEDTFEVITAENCEVKQILTDTPGIWGVHATKIDKSKPAKIKFEAENKNNYEVETFGFEF